MDSFSLESHLDSGQVRVEDLGFETRITHDHMEFQAIAEEPI
jgi:hypothetical protein